jgi:hypothetical protein
MGWLRDLMATSDPPVASFGRLAETALAHPRWPADTQPKARSLATLFSKLDREQDLEWLVDRPDVQRVLAELMQRPLGDVQQALPVRRPQTAGRVVSLTDVRYARELDLTKERLCPGIPLVLYEPSTWDALAWRAPSGAGRSLVGAWLTARGLATHLSVERSLDGVDVPPRGPLFVEVESADAAISFDDWYEALGAAHRPVCIASAAEVPRAHTRFKVLLSPSVSSVLPELVDWVERRLGDEGNFDAERALLFMQRVALPSGAVRSLGDAIGLLGMLDEVRPRTLSGRSLDEIAESFVRARIDDSSRESTGSAWLNRNAFPALLGTVAQLVTESDRSPTAPRTFDEWLSLVPSEHRHGVDVEWMRTALGPNSGSNSGAQASSTGFRLRSEDVARAARKLPPGGYQLIKSLEHARLLVRDGEQLRLRPQWLCTLLHARATDEVLSTSPVVWGETLLRPAHAARTMRALYSRALRGKLEPLYDAVELEAPENPASVAAVDAASTALGLALLAGANVPSDLVNDLLEESERTAVSLPGSVPAPRLPHPDALGAEEPLLHHGAWLLAQLALAERSELAARRRTFNPWSAPPGTFRQLLRDVVYPSLESFLSRLDARDAAGSSTGDDTARLWTLATYALVDRLRRTSGAAAELPSALELPSAVCDALERGTDDGEKLSRLFQLPHGLAALGEVARGRGLSISNLSKSVWDALARLRRLPTALEPLAAETLDADARALWRELPTELVRTRLASGQYLPWEVLLPHHHAAALGANVPLPEQAVEHAPRATLFEALQTRGLELVTPRGYELLWRKAPREMLSLVSRRLDARTLDGLHVLLSAATRDPAQHETHVLSELVHALSTRADVTTFPREALDHLRVWLADGIARRLPGWRDAYPLFHTIEEGMRPLRLGQFGGTPSR